MIEVFKGVAIRKEKCIACTTCSWVCPFEAISLDEKHHIPVLDLEKCQVCGLCPSTCPAYAIDIAYYDQSSILNYVKKQMDATGLRTLIVTCRGSLSPQSSKAINFLDRREVNNFISLRLPCVGRVSIEFFLKVFLMGIQNITVIQCDEEYCRFKNGSRTSLQRISQLHGWLNQLGFKKSLTVIKKSNKAIYVTENCVGCGKCEFICPYDAIELQPAGTPIFSLEDCVGCGACALACPHQAVELEGFEFGQVSKLIHNYSIKAQELKDKAVKPVILVFCCQWSEFSGLDALDHSPQNSSLDENIIIIEIPCFKGLDPTHVLEAFYLGFDGVLAVICPEDDCKLVKGREIAEQNSAVLKKVLKQMKLHERFEIQMATPRYLKALNSKLEFFVKKISLLSTKAEVI